MSLAIDYVLSEVGAEETSVAFHDYKTQQPLMTVQHVALILLGIFSIFS